MASEPKIKLTTFWSEYYEFMRRLLPLYAKKKITKSQYDFFEAFKKKLPYYHIEKDPDNKKLINAVCVLFVKNAWFRKIFDGYTFELRNSMVKSMKISSDSKKMRQLMFDKMVTQDPNGFNETDTTVIEKPQNLIKPANSTAKPKLYYTPEELRAAAMKTFRLTEADMVKPENHTHKYNYMEYFEDNADEIRLQFDTGETINWGPGSFWTKYVFVASNNLYDGEYDNTGRVTKMENNYTADVVSDKDMIRNRNRFDTYAEARQAILDFFGLK